MSEQDKNFDMQTPAIVADDAVGVPRWYVAYVGTRAEKAVRDRLISLGYEAYAATQWEIHVWRNGRKKKIERPVITQYVFIRLTERQRSVVVTMPEIHYFMVNKAGPTNEYGRHLPAVIPDSQMQMLASASTSSAVPTWKSPPTSSSRQKVQIQISQFLAIKIAVFLDIRT